MGDYELAGWVKTAEKGDGGRKKERRSDTARVR